ncbi:hypothetical protein QTP88_023559 [Uroleucon formosanum]
MTLCLVTVVQAVLAEQTLNWIRPHTPPPPSQPSPTTREQGIDSEERPGTHGGFKTVKGSDAQTTIMTISE